MAARGCGASPQPLFFRVLFPNFSTKLKLPPDFVEKHLSKKEKKASTSATLIGPDGQTWKIYLGNDKENHHKYFYGGEWNECIRAYDLQEGYLLLFCYEGKMVFNFVVYDLTACEKTYPLPANVSEINLAAGKRAKRSRTCKGQHVFKSIGQCKNGAQITYQCKDCMCICFEATITQYNLERPYMRIPSKFIAFSCLSKEQHGVTLIGLKGQSWPVRLMYTESRNTYYMGLGWLEFVHENQLKFGDRCAFEMEAGDKWAIKVQKIRG